MIIKFEWRGNNCYIGSVRFGSITDYVDFWGCAINLPGIAPGTGGSNNHFINADDARAAFERRVTGWFELCEPSIERPRRPHKSED